MQPKNHERLQARNLYFGSDLSQQQIASLLNINRKTLHGWATEGCWRRAKYSAASAPSVLLDQYYHQLGAINRAIAERDERPWPTKEEADIIRKITATIKQIKDGKVGISETIEVFSAFTDTLRRGDKDEQLLKSIIIPMDKHVKSYLDKGKELDFARIHYQEERDEKDYAEWLATQQAEPEQTTPTEVTPQPENPTQAIEPTAPGQADPNSSADRHDLSADRHDLSADRNKELTERFNLLAERYGLPAGDATMGSPAETQQPDDQQTPQNLSTNNNENAVSRQLSVRVSENDENKDQQPDENSAIKPPAATNNNQPGPITPTPSPCHPKGFRHSRIYPGRKRRS